jgi:hypothetical protein
VEIKTKHKLNPQTLSSRDYYFDVDIPVWIRDPRRPEDRTDLTVEALNELGADMWISITEIRESNLKDGPKSRVKYNRDCICSKGHTYEWLACGAIPESRVMRVMPYDGKTLYEEETTKIIRSLHSTEPWVWSWGKKMWVLDARLTAIAEWRDMELHQVHEKRKHSSDGDAGEELEPSKRPRVIELAIVRPYFKLSASQQTSALAS